MIRMFESSITNEIIRELILEASKDPEIRLRVLNLSMVRATLIADALSRLVGHFDDQKAVEEYKLKLKNDLPFQVSDLYLNREAEKYLKIIINMNQFLRIAREKFLINDPVKAFIIYLSILAEESLTDAPPDDYSEPLSVSNLDQKLERLNPVEALEEISEEDISDMQKLTGGLSPLECARIILAQGLNKKIRSAVAPIKGRIKIEIPTREVKNRGGQRQFKLGGDLRNLARRERLSQRLHLKIAEESYLTTLRSDKMGNALYIVLLDMSASMTSSIKPLHSLFPVKRYQLSAGVINSILEEVSKGAEVFLGLFDERISDKLWFKTPKEVGDFLRSYGYSKFVGGSTAIDEAIKELLKIKDLHSEQYQKRSFVIITDGEDSFNHEELADLINQSNLGMHVILTMEEHYVNKISLYRTLDLIQSKDKSFYVPEIREEELSFRNLLSSPRYSS